NILLPTLVTSLAIRYGFNVGIASAILTITIIVFSDVIPKSVAAAFQNRISMVVSPIIRFFVFVLYPVTKVLIWLTDRIIYLLSNGMSADDVSVSNEELRSMVDIADSEGLINETESNRIKGVLDFYNLDIKHVLKAPRGDIIALPS